MSATQTLAKFVAETGYEDLPRTLIGECKIATLDAFAAAFVGSSRPWAQRVVEMVHELGGKPEVSVVEPAVEDRCLARRARERRDDRRVRMRATDRLPCLGHRASGGTRGKRARALRRQDVPSRACARLRSFRAPAKDRGWSREHARLPQPRRAGALRCGCGGRQALRLRCRNARECAGACGVVRRRAARVRVEQATTPSAYTSVARARWDWKARSSRARACTDP